MWQQGERLPPVERAGQTPSGSHVIKSTTGALHPGAPLPVATLDLPFVQLKLNAAPPQADRAEAEVGA